MTERARTIFLGSGSFAVPIVSALVEHPSTDLVAILTAPARRGSRGHVTDPPVAVWAAEHGLPMLRPARLRDRESLAEIAALQPSLLVLADYGQMVPTSLLELPPHGALNLHPSLLPRHRGATPIMAAILEGDGETGVSLMRMDAGLDTGPIVAQASRPLAGGETSPELERELAHLAARLLAATIDDWLNGRATSTPQAGEGATLTRPLRREDGRLNPSLTALRLERQVRAYQPWPGSFIETPEGRLVVWRATVAVSSPTSPPGKLLQLASGALGLAVIDGTVELSEVQPAGGRRMSGTELLRGRPALIGSSVHSGAEAGPGSSA